MRSDRLMMDWLTLADPRTGLLPRMAEGKDRDIWNAKDCAADLYPFLVLTAWYTRPRALRGADARTSCSPRPRSRRGSVACPTRTRSRSRASPRRRIDTASIMFGGSEYVKDGLMPITELLGVTPWRARMLDIVDDLWRYAPIETPFGRIVSLDPEVNGDMLLVLSRLYWMTQRRAVSRVRDAARRLLPPVEPSPDARLRDAAAARPRQRGRVGADRAVRDAAEGAAGEGERVSRADPRDARPDPRGGAQRGRAVLQRHRSARRTSGGCGHRRQLRLRPQRLLHHLPARRHHRVSRRRAQGARCARREVSRLQLGGPRRRRRRRRDRGGAVPVQPRARPLGRGVDGLPDQVDVEQAGLGAPPAPGAVARPRDRRRLVRRRELQSHVADVRDVEDAGH